MVRPRDDVCVPLTGQLLGTFTSGGFLDYPSNLAQLVVPEPVSLPLIGATALAIVLRRFRGD